MKDTIGARLKQAREQRHVTLQQASETTKVRTHYLKALENDDLSAMPSVAQARGFLHLYAEFLGLNLGELSASLTSLDVGAATDAKPVAPAPARPPAAAASDIPLSSSPGEVMQAKPLGLGLIATLRNRLARWLKVDSDVSQTAPAATAVQVPDLQPDPSLPEPILSTLGHDPEAEAAGGSSMRDMAAVPASDDKNGYSKMSSTPPLKPAFAADEPEAVKKKS